MEAAQSMLKEIHKELRHEAAARLWCFVLELGSILLLYMDVPYRVANVMIDLFSMNLPKPFLKKLSKPVAVATSSNCEFPTLILHCVNTLFLCLLPFHLAAMNPSIRRKDGKHFSLAALSTVLIVFIYLHVYPTFFHHGSQSYGNGRSQMFSHGGTNQH